MKVHFLARIVLVDVLTITCRFIDRILHRENTTCSWMLSDTDRITKPPTQTQPIRVIGIAICRDLAKIESLDLTMT